MKNLLHGELAEDTRKVGRLFLRIKDTMKDILKRSGVHMDKLCKGLARVAKVN